MSALGDLAASIAQKVGIPPNLFRAQIAQESGTPGDLTGASWNPMAVGKAGELGLGQLSAPIIAQYGVGNAFDPTQNLTGAAAYLKSLYNQYGSWNAALSAYNAGSPSSSAGQQYASSIIGASGLAGSSTPGIQPVPATSSNPGSGGAAGSVAVGSWGYVAAIGVIIILVIAGVVAVARG